MEGFIAMAGTYLTAENIAWFLGAVIGMEQALAYTKIIKSNSSLELIWNILKYIYALCPKKAGRIGLPVLLLAISIGCASLPPVEDIRKDIDGAEVALVVVEELVTELSKDGVTAPDNIKELVKGVVVARELLDAAKVFIQEGNRSDAIEKLIAFTKLMLKMEKQ